VSWEYSRPARLTPDRKVRGDGQPADATTREHCPRDDLRKPGPSLPLVPLLHEWGIGELADDAELVVSELATNALKASQSLQEVRPFALCLRSDCKRLIIEVWDHSPREPRSALAGGDAEGGRGLLVVESLSTRWGYQRTGYSTKVVWAELNNPPM
jgi:hypothetical protein